MMCEGVFEYRSGYFLAQPPLLSQAVFDRLRAAYPQSVGGQRVLAVRDLGTGLDTSQPGAIGRLQDVTLCRAPFVTLAC